MASVAFHEGEGATERGLIRDISRGGCFLATSQKHAVGVALELEFRLPSGKTVHGTGVVVWGRESTTGAPAGLGIKFARIDDEALAAIDRLASAAQQQKRAQTMIGVAPPSAPAVHEVEAPSPPPPLAPSPVTPSPVTPSPVMERAGEEKDLEWDTTAPEPSPAPAPEAAPPPQPVDEIVLPPPLVTLEPIVPEPPPAPPVEPPAPVEPPPAPPPPPPSPAVEAPPVLPVASAAGRQQRVRLMALAGLGVVGLLGVIGLMMTCGHHGKKITDLDAPSDQSAPDTSPPNQEEDVQTAPPVVDATIVDVTVNDARSDAALDAGAKDAGKDGGKDAGKGHGKDAGSKGRDAGKKKH